MVRDERGLGSVLKAIILVAIFAVAYWGAFVLVRPNLPQAFTPPIAETSDFIEVDYIGTFPGTGKVFDTSIESVARDNATFPKAASFSYRSGPGGRYAPLQFTMGCTPGSLCPLPAFQNAILGMHVGESRIVTLTPEEAYGLPDPSRIRTRPLREEVVVTETMNKTEFGGRFAVAASDGAIVKDLTWGWNVSVRVAGDLVTIRHSPLLGEIVTVGQRWQAEVVSIDDAANGGRGAITVQHLLTTADVNAWVAEDTEGNFIVVALDRDAGTFTVDYNQEVVGKSLVFELTLKALRKGNP
jgi:FKBP-type peptidyl-prolyl cis-trans isomerase 2